MIFCIYVFTYLRMTDVQGVPGPVGCGSFRGHVLISHKKGSAYRMSQADRCLVADRGSVLSSLVCVSV